MPTATERNINRVFTALVADLDLLITFSRELKILVDAINNAKTPEAHALLRAKIQKILEHRNIVKVASEKMPEIYKQAIADLEKYESDLDSYLSQPYH